MGDGVKSADRVLDILELLAVADRPLALREIADRLSIPKSSTLMLLRTLEARGYAARGADDGYVLDAAAGRRDEAALELGWGASRPMRLLRVARPVMQDLVDTLQETTTLGALRPDGDVQVLGAIVSPLAIRYDLGRLKVIPGYCTAMGQAMLAFQDADTVERYIARCRFERLTERTIGDAPSLRIRLAQIRRRGWSVHIDERFLGASGAAVPISDETGRVVAAINIATVTVRFRKRQGDIVAGLRAAAARISAALGAPVPEVSSAASVRRQSGG